MTKILKKKCITKKSIFLLLFLGFGCIFENTPIIKKIVMKA